MADPDRLIAEMVKNASVGPLDHFANWHQPNRTGLILSGHGIPKPILANAITVMQHSPVWSGVIKHDVFASQIVLARQPPWEDDEFEGPRLWSDRDDIHAANWLQRSGIEVPVGVASQAVSAIADANRWHPVADYLDSLSWDGEVRLDKWVSRYFGATDNSYHAEIGRCSLIAAVARIRNPGCKVDTIPILEGSQGKKKSTALRRLFEPWFTDEVCDFGSKDAAMQLRGVWLVEISELEAMSRSEVGRIKAFASRMVDRFRPPYGIRVIDSPRSCVFWGTTNSENYLRDETGGRRFWPIKTGTIDETGIIAARNQLWAEAQVRYSAREPWWIVDSSIEEIANTEQSARYVGDPWDPMIAAHVETRDEVSVQEILAKVIGLDKSRWEQADQNRVARSLKTLGFVRRQVRRGGVQIWKYLRDR